MVFCVTCLCFLVCSVFFFFLNVGIVFQIKISVSREVIYDSLMHISWLILSFLSSNDSSCQRGFWIESSFERINIVFIVCYLF